MAAKGPSLFLFHVQTSLASLFSVSLFRSSSPLPPGPGCRSAPAPGYRIVDSGELCRVGYSGFSWSSTVSGSNSYYLDFYPTRLVPQTSTHRAIGRQLRCLQEEGFRCPAGRHPACFRGHSVKPSGPDPLGKNQSLSSPPLEPRGLLLSAMRQKVSKERSQGVFAPLANPRRNCPNLAKPSCGPPPAGKSYERRRVAHPARGGGGSRDSLSRNFSTCGPTSGHPRSLSARLGDSFYFAECKIVESLLRRGARCRSAREPGSLYPKQRTAILRIATFSALTQQRSPDDGPELRPAKARCFSLTLERTSQAPARKTSRPHGLGPRAFLRNAAS